MNASNQTEKRTRSPASNGAPARAARLTAMAGSADPPPRDAEGWRAGLKLPTEQVAKD